MKIDRDLKVVYNVWILGILLVGLIPFVSVSETNDYYFDVSDGGPTDFQGVWSNDSDGFDGNINTDATTDTTSIGEGSNNNLRGDGTNAPADGETITQVRARLHDGINYGSYVTLDAPVAGWSWAAAQGLEVLVFRNAFGGSVTTAFIYEDGDYEGTILGGPIGANTGGFSIVEIEVTSEVVDTCTCAGAGNDWEINMSDYCNITTACDLTTGTLSFTGTGWCNCNASVDTTNLGDPGASGILYIQDSCLITID